MKCGEDFDAFDRIDPEVGVEPHVRFEHLRGVAGLLGDDFEQFSLKTARVGDRLGGERLGLRKGDRGRCDIRNGGGNLGTFRNRGIGLPTCDRRRGRGFHAASADLRRRGRARSLKLAPKTCVGESLLLFEQALERPMRPLLPFEEPAMKLGRLFAESMQRDKVFLRGPKGL